MNKKYLLIGGLIILGTYLYFNRKKAQEAAEEAAKE